MSAETNNTSSRQERELKITRLLDAPPDLVFKVWTQPEHFSRWLGPKNFTTTFCQIDLRLGGRYRACIRSPEGEDYWMQGVYHQIVEPERLVFTFAWEDENGKPKHQTIVTVVFANQDGKTLLTFHQAVFESTESRDSHRLGWSECFDRLDAYLTNEQMSK